MISYQIRDNYGPHTPAPLSFLLGHSSKVTKGHSKTYIFFTFGHSATQPLCQNSPRLDITKKFIFAILPLSRSVPKVSEIRYFKKIIFAIQLHSHSAKVSRSKLIQILSNPSMIFISCSMKKARNFHIFFILPLSRTATQPKFQDQR